MLAGLLVVLFILWFLGYVHIGSISVPDAILFTINGRSVTLWDLLILLIISWIIGILPGPLRAVAAVLLILWVLSVLGIISLAGIGLSSLLVIAIIAGVLFSLFTAAV